MKKEMIKRFLDMKKFYLFGILVFAAFALIGCAKELSETKEGVETHKVTFTIQQGIDTRTTFEERDGKAHYKWTAGDASRFHVFENNVEPQDFNVEFSSDYEKATVTATFANTGEDNLVYTAYYAASMSGSDPEVPAIQAPGTTSFDPAADVLVADPITLSGTAGESTGELLFTFTREVSINRIRLTGLSGKNISYVSLIPKSGSAGFADGCDSLKLNYNGAAAGDNFDVYFTCIPSSTARDYKIRVVTTDGSMYYRDNLSTRTFDTDQFRRFSIALANYAVVPAATPTISLASGYIKTGTTHSVTLTSATEGATIYYTTDGNDPTISSSQYSGPISVSSSQTIKAIATKENFLKSAVASAQYVEVDDYTLDGTDAVPGTNSAWDGTSTITQDSESNLYSLSWSVEGKTTEGPWRIGGKKYTGDRSVYCSGFIRGHVSNISVEHGSSSVTVNSMTIVVASNSSFTNVVSSQTPTYSSSVTVNGNDDWCDCYYKIIYNIKAPANSGYLQFKSAAFTVDNYFAHEF